MICFIGVFFIIFEVCFEVIVNIVVFVIKFGNVVIFKGGKEFIEFFVVILCVIFFVFEKI